MSSILKALKRVETESPPLQSHQSLSRPIDSRQALNASTKKRWHARRLIYLFLILSVIAGAAALVLSQRELLIARLSLMIPAEAPSQSAPDENGAGVYRAKVPKTTTQPTQPRRNVTRQPADQIKRPAPAGRDDKFQSRPTSGSRRSTARSATPPQPAVSRPSSRTASKAKVTPPPRQTKPASATASVKKPEARKKPKAARLAARRPQPLRTYDRINDDKMRLQALAWAEDEARRMAVINGRIVHEGESVDGYQILKIREDDVIVQQDGKSWRLEFGLQQ